MTMTVRHMRPDDAAAVADLSGQMGYSTVAGDAQRRLARIAEHPHARAFVAESLDGRVVGWVHVYGVDLLGVESHGELGGQQEPIVDGRSSRGDL